jgi:hypothetical protein
MILGFACAPPKDPPPDTVDTDGDGLSDADEVNVWGTNPLLADTDGDGWTDGVEVKQYAFDPLNNPYRFNPRIADVPELRVEFTSAPIVTMRVTTTQGESKTFQTSQAYTNDVSQTNGVADAERQANTLETPQTISTDVTRDADGGVESTSTDVSSTVNPSTTTETTITISQAQTQDYSETYQELQAYTQSFDVATSGGDLTLTAVIQNQGHIAFRVDALILSAVLVTEQSDFTPLGNLAIDSPYTSPFYFSLGPGESSGPINFIRSSLTLEVAETILQDVQAVVVDLGVEELLNSGGTPFAFSLDEIGSKTATISIDYGAGDPPERYLVATNLDAGHPGVTVGRILDDILRIPFISNQDTGLTAVRQVTTTQNKGTWTVVHHHIVEGEVVTTPYPSKGYDFRTIEVHAGDVLSLTYVPR